MISSATSRVAVRMIRTDEKLMIAKTVCEVLRLGVAVTKRAVLKKAVVPTLAANKNEIQRRTIENELFHTNPPLAICSGLALAFVLAVWSRVQANPPRLRRSNTPWRPP